MAPFGAGLHDGEPVIHRPDHGSQVGDQAEAREGRSAGVGVRGLSLDQAIEAPAAALVGGRAGRRGGLRLETGGRERTISCGARGGTRPRRLTDFSAEGEGDERA